MRSNIIPLGFVLFANFFYAQVSTPLNRVGINTTNPQRTLHVEGNLRVSDGKNHSQNSAYSNVLVIDQNGNVDHVLRDDFLPPPDPYTSQKEVKNSIYNKKTDEASPDKIVTCGKFVFLFEQDGAQTDFRFRLKDKPSTNIEVYVSMEQNWAPDDGFQFYQGRTSTDADPFLFTITDSTAANYWSKNQDFASSNVADYEQNTIHFQYPNDAAFYRLSIYKVKHSDSWDFVTACEKF
jgi:hypothetical protein